MQQILIILAEQLNSAVFILLFLLLVAFWAVYKITQMFTQWQEQRSGYERLSKNLHELREDVGTIRARLDFLFQKQSPSSAVVSSSPIQMTAVGKKISACIDAPGIIDAHWDSLCKWALADNPKHPYDIQLAAFTAVEKHLIELLSEEQLDQAKAQALEYGIPLDNALAVVGVLLRDKLLKQQGYSTPQTAAKSAPPD